MTYAIVYSSQTGNTALLAQRLKDCLPRQGLLYFGFPDAAALEAEVLFVGSWTDKGSCCPEIATFLKSRENGSFCLAPPVLVGRRPTLPKLPSGWPRTCPKTASCWAVTSARAKCPRRSGPGMRPWPCRIRRRHAPCWRILTGPSPIPTRQTWRGWSWPPQRPGSRPEHPQQQRVPP